MNKSASLKTVFEKIVNRVRDWELAKQLAEKVRRFDKTHNPADDLSPRETAIIYQPDHYGDRLPLTKHRNIDVDWSNHAEFRCDLRDIDPDKINEDVRDRVRSILLDKGPMHRRDKMNLPDGTVVMEHDTTVNPAEAEIVTVWASDVLAALRDMGVQGLGIVAGSQNIKWQAVFMIGAPGAGKSFYRASKYLAESGFRVIDPDLLKQSHPKYNPDRPSELHEWSRDVSNAEYARYVSDGTGDPIVIDGTGRHIDGIIKKINMAKDAGYRIYVVCVWVPLEVSLYRNRNRGRFVPEMVVMATYAQVEKSLAALRGLADKIKVVPNFEEAEHQKAIEDMEQFPPPQRSRPPRGIEAADIKKPRVVIPFNTGTRVHKDERKFDKKRDRQQSRWQLKKDYMGCEHD